MLLEAALTTIMDCEDSVAAVDAEDKVHIYRNWLGLMKGDLTEQVSKGGKTFTRKLNADRQYTRPDGSALTLHGRSLMFVRNVGHLMTNPAVLDREGREIPEGILDAVVTSLAALQDRKNKLNSRTGSVTSSSPRCTAPSKPPSPARSSTASKTCWACRATLKMGIMDEERRTSINLKACIAAAAPRGLHQHRLPGPHGRRDALQHGSRPDAAQGRHEVDRLDRGL